jgi:hypothetical protein
MDRKELEQGIRQIIDNMMKDDGDELFDNFEWIKEFVTGEELIDELMVQYIRDAEGWPLSRDKSSFIARQIIKAAEQGKHLPLQETYKEYIERGGNMEFHESFDMDKRAFWCPNTLTDTRQAIKLLFAIMHSFGASKQKTKEYMELSAALDMACQVIADNNDEFAGMSTVKEVREYIMDQVKTKQDVNQKAGG